MRLSSLFGPLALIIGKQIEDTLKFLVLLALFLFGFTMLTMALNEPLVFDGTEDDALNSFSKTNRKDQESGGGNLKKGMPFPTKMIDSILSNTYNIQVGKICVDFIIPFQKQMLMTC